MGSTEQEQAEALRNNGLSENNFWQFNMVFRLIHKGDRDDLYCLIENYLVKLQNLPICHFSSNGILVGRIF